MFTSAILARIKQANSRRLALAGLFWLVVALAVLIPLYHTGFFPPLNQDRTASFERLWRAVDVYYPYFEQKGVDWDAIHGRYRPQIEAAQSDNAYFALIADMLAELNDAHTGLVAPDAFHGRLYFGTAVWLDDGVVADRVGDTGRQAGLKQGDLLLAINGQPVTEAIAALPPRLRSGSTPWQRQTNAAFHLLSTPGNTLEVTWETAVGEQRTVTLIRPDEMPHPAAAVESPETVINGRRLPSGLGLIRIPTFSSDTGHDLVAEFDAALDGLMDAPGIILDLRGNGGGSSFISDRIGGRFLSQPFTYGCETYRQRLPWHAWQLRWAYRIRPRQPVYTGPLILLIDTANMSTAELFIAALADSGRAQTVGRQTAGASGNPVTFRLPGGGLARFSTGAFRRRDGTPIEGVGITPDIPTAYTVAAFRQGDDPDLAAAERLLLDGENNPAAQQTTKIRRDTTMLVKLFGFTLAAAIALTSLAMIVWGERWYRAEVAAYGGARRPWWFYALSALIIGFYLAALVSFIGGDKNWAGWVLMVFIPTAWLLKSVLLIFNPKGREKITGLSTGSAWGKIGLARLPLALILAGLAALV